MTENTLENDPNNEPYPFTSKTGKRYREITYKGKPAWEFESETILDPSNGQILRAPPSAMITRETSPTLIQRRVQLAREKLIEGALEEIDGNSETDLQKYLGAALVRHGAAGGPGGSAYMRSALQAFDYVEDQARGSAGLTLTMSEEVARKLLSRLGKGE